MTSDYVHYVLGLQGWERAINKRGFLHRMAGEEDYLDEGQVPCHTEEVSNTVCFCETGCQTPSEWSDSGLAQKAEDEVPKLAPTRLVLLSADRYDATQPARTPLDRSL